MGNRMFREIESYVNEIVAAFVAPINNIESVKCARRADHVYMELVHEDSYTRYFDISSLDESAIGLLVGNIIANNPIKREIQDRVVKKEIRKLFR